MAGVTQVRARRLQRRLMGCVLKQEDESVASGRVQTEWGGLFMSGTSQESFEGPHFGFQVCLSLFCSEENHLLLLFFPPERF